MEANKALEKIYVGIVPSDLGNYKYTTVDKDFPNAIEYTRTDTFIEKAVRFIEKIDDVDEYSWYNEEEHTAGITEKCIEDFKKYMEG